VWQEGALNVVTMLDLLAEQGVTVPSDMPARLTPVKPIIRHAAFGDSESGRWRKVLLHRWGSGPCLFWLCYCPDKSTALTNDLAVKRIITWTYRNHYAGFVVASLYPALVDTRAQARAWRRNEPGTLSVLIEAAHYAGQQAKRNQCTDIVIATGPLVDPLERVDLSEWLETFRASRGPRKTRWLCAGTTETGWPIPPAGHGRSTPPLDVQLVPWRQPVEPPERKRAPAAAASA
jgi:hypothetical protein